ncbi:hypothetical protein ACTQ49_02770 [Luteococcus sp. Sow4_B9]|uniref:hypothetical protein n=1 Tax=Luteococcus sp. Sow4_B9 TaxID=3438792 RepID=UPI003F9C6291
MTEILGLSAALAVTLALALVAPLLLAPLLLIWTALAHRRSTHRREGAASSRARTSVHDLPTVHPGSHPASRRLDERAVA